MMHLFPKNRNLNSLRAVAEGTGWGMGVAGTYAKEFARLWLEVKKSANGWKELYMFQKCPPNKNLTIEEMIG